MARIQRRKHGAEKHAENPAGETHKLAVGFNAGTGERATFGKLNGFCVFRASLGADGKYPVDYAAMRELIASGLERSDRRRELWRRAVERLNVPHDPADPVSPAALKAVIEEQFSQRIDAPGELLPGEVEFGIPANARRGPSGQWEYPGLFSEAFEAFRVDGCPGMF